jgi:hypothetical protein
MNTKHRFDSIHSGSVSITAFEKMKDSKVRWRHTHDVNTLTDGQIACASTHTKENTDSMLAWTEYSMMHGKNTTVCVWLHTASTSSPMTVLSASAVCQHTEEGTGRTSPVHD